MRCDCSVGKKKLPTYSIENDMSIDPTRGRRLTLRNILSAVPIFDYILYPIDIMCLSFINECRDVQNISSQEKASVEILLRGKLHGRIRKALHHR